MKESNFKTYDELKTRLDIVLGNTQSAAMSAPSSVDQVDHTDVPFDGGVPMTDTSSSNDENLDYFKKLAEA